MEVKKRYKMYKKGKHWIIAPILFIGILAFWIDSNSVQAAEMYVDGQSNRVLAIPHLTNKHAPEKQDEQQTAMTEDQVPEKQDEQQTAMTEDQVPEKQDEQQTAMTEDQVPEKQDEQQTAMTEDQVPEKLDERQTITAESKEAEKILGNYDGTLPNFKSEKNISTNKFTKYNNGNFNGKLMYIPGVTKSVAFFFDSEGNFLYQNEFTGRKSDANYSPKDVNYYYNGYYGQWNTSALPANSSAKVLISNAGIYNQEFFDAIVDIKFGAGRNNYIILSGRDFLATPSIMSKTTITFYRHNSEVSLDKVKQMKLRTVSEIDSVFKDSKVMDFKGTINLYDFDIPNKMFTISDKYIDNIYYSEEQKASKDPMGLKVLDEKYTFIGSSDGNNASNNFNHMISLNIISKDSKISYKQQARVYNETVGMTNVSLMLEKILPGLGSVEQNTAWINRYVPFMSTEFDSDLLPLNINDLDEQFKDSIKFKKIKGIKVNTQDTKGFVLQKIDTTNEVELEFEIDNRSKEAYGKLSQLGVELTLDSSITDFSEDEKKELLHYVDWEAKTINIPVEFFYKNQDSTGKWISRLIGKNVVSVTLNDYYYNMLLDEDRNTAIAAIQAAAEAKKESFKGIDGVDPESLKAQSDLVDQEASKAIEAINMAPTKGTVTEAKVKGEEAIKAVSDPTVIEANKKATDEDRNTAIAAIQAAAEAKKESFKGIDGVDPESLKAQSDLVDQ
ncbi:DUF1542 domain-containing protein, partial [Enterococcus faecalis]|nr:DUF1542 domain-containing protein [Enterococcus faecalis]